MSMQNTTIEKHIHTNTQLYGNTVTQTTTGNKNNQTRNAQHKQYKQNKPESNGPQNSIK